MTLRPKFKTKLCVVCGKQFLPTSGVQKCCDKMCYRVHKNKNQIKWYWNNLNRSRQIKRKWNNSEKGKSNREKYYIKNKDIIYKRLEKYKESSYARIKSARKLKRTGIKWICSHCHNPNKKPNVHHKDMNPFNDNLDNLILLCRGCHANVHRELNLIIKRNPSSIH